MAEQELGYVTYSPLQVSESPRKEQDKSSKWRQYVAGIAACMSLFAGGAWFTWPTPLLPRLLSPDSPLPMTPEEASWIVSFIELGCLFPVAPFMATFTANAFGRKMSMLFCAPILFVTFLMTLYWKTVVSLCIARTLQGIAICFPYTILPLYLGEIASPEARGTVTSFFHVFWGLGCLFPYCVGPYLSYEDLTYAVFTLTVIYVLCFAWQPESPFYYAMKKDTEKTAAMLRRLRDSPPEEEIQREIEEIQLEVKKCMEAEKASWKDIVATPADRRALLLLAIVGIVSFLSGQNAILTYTTETFYRLKIDFISPDLVTLLVGVVALLGSVFSIFTSDRYGRRFLLFFSSIGCMISLFTAAVFFYLHENTDVDLTSFQWVAPIAVMAYNLFVTAGMHPVCVTYTSELFPTKTRGLASGLSNMNLALMSFIVLKTYESVSTSLGVYFIYMCYAIVCLIGTILFYFMMPETKGKTFLEIREALEKSQNK